MGGSGSKVDSGLQQYIRGEFDRVRDEESNRDYLVLSEVLRLKPPDDIAIDFRRIGNLFALDQDKDGRFTFDEMINFAQMCKQRQSEYKPHELQQMLQASFTLNLWQYVCADEGEDNFLGWIGRLLYESQEVTHLENQPGQPFIKSDTVRDLYEIFNTKTTLGMDFQMIFDLMQQAGEDAGLMKVDSEEVEDYVPLVVCQQFARDFIRGFSNLMNEIGFSNMKDPE